MQRGVVDAVSNPTSSDVVTVLAFNNEIQVIGPDKQSQFPIREFLAVKPDGGTKLYEAIATAFALALRLHVVVDASTRLETLTYVVVMTDGEDTGSSCSLPQLMGIVSEVNSLRNFKASLLCVLSLVSCVWLEYDGARPSFTPQDSRPQYLRAQ